MPTFFELIKALDSFPDPLWIVFGILVSQTAVGINARRTDVITDDDNKADNATENKRLDFDIEKWKKQVSDDLLRDTKAALEEYKVDIAERENAHEAEIKSIINRLNDTHSKEVKDIHELYRLKMEAREIVFNQRMGAMRAKYVAEIDRRDREIVRLENRDDLL